MYSQLNLKNRYGRPTNIALTWLLTVIFDQIRNIKDGRHMVGPWIGQVLLSSPTEAEVPTSFACQAAKSDEVVVHATTSFNGGVQPICRGKEGATGKNELKSNIHIFESVEEAFDECGGRFCKSCEPMLRASLRVKVNQCYGR